MQAHDLAPAPVQGFRCKVCGLLLLKPDPASACPGVKVYPWSPWPDGLYTKKQIEDKGFKPGPVAGVIRREKSPDGWMKLYRLEEATPKKVATAAQLAALEKARICERCGRRTLYTKGELSRRRCEGCDYELMIAGDKLRSAQLAHNLMYSDDLIIWDSETTDLDGRFIEIAVIDLRGNVLFDERLAPQEWISPGAYDVHGIPDEALVSCPTLVNIYPRLRHVLNDQRWLIYNSDFDMSILRSEVRYSVYKSYFERYPIKWRDTFCLMHMYAFFYGDWRGSRRGYRWQKLENAAQHFKVEVPYAAHSALGDCYRALGVLRGMADYYLEKGEE
jgi:DNA polymerase-3 subunit epsilon